MLCILSILAGPPVPCHWWYVYFDHTFQRFQRPIHCGLNLTFCFRTVKALHPKTPLTARIPTSTSTTFRGSSPCFN